MLMVNLSVVAGLLCFWLKQQASCHHQRVHVRSGGVQGRGALPDQPSFSRNWILFTGTLKMFFLWVTMTTALHSPAELFILIGAVIPNPRVTTLTESRSHTTKPR